MQSSVLAFQPISGTMKFQIRPFQEEKMHRSRQMSSEQKMIVAAIPFYPETIRIPQLEAITGLLGLLQRIDSLPDGCLVCQDDCGALSRLKGDLTNVD